MNKKIEGCVSTIYTMSIKNIEGLGKNGCEGFLGISLQKSCINED